MNTYVYGDVILLENFAMNYLILWSTAKILKLKHAKLRFIASAGMGALYAVLSYFPQFKYLSTIIMKLLLSILMVTIALGPNSIKQYLKCTGVFYLVSFIFGGAAFGLFYFFNSLSTTVNGVAYIADFPVKMLIVSAVIAYIIVKYCWDYVQYKIRREKIFSEIWISYNAKKSCITALVDTGNALSEPITKAPVIVAEYKAIKELLPKEIQRIFEENKEDDLNILSKILYSSDWITRFRVIPFKSLGRENGMLIGFRPDEVYITDKDKKIKIANVIIGIYNRQLSSNSEYSALVHPDLFCDNAGDSKIS